jgi:transposase-like protein
MEVKIKVCPYEDCKSTHIVSHGKVNTVKKGLRKRYKCQTCAKTFYFEENESKS